MKFGEMLRKTPKSLMGLVAGLHLATLSGAAMAQEAEVADGAASVADAASAYTPLGPDMIKGQPEPGGIWLQDQYSPIGHDGVFMHDAVLMPVITAIVIVVLVLMLWIMARYNRRTNPNPSKTSHNTLLEVIWTGVPIIILVLIAIPSINLLIEQYESPPEDALTVKVTGYQWYWGYGYPDNGDFEVVSNMMPDEEAVEKGLPPQLAVDNRMVVPVGVPIRIQTTGADVIHSFAVPSLWFKLDTVPGRLNEKLLEIEEPGIYYGQCSELCGARHGYMPIAVEAVPMEDFNKWVLSQGGTVGGDVAAAEEAEAPTAEEATDEAADEAAPAEA